MERRTVCSYGRLNSHCENRNSHLDLNYISNWHKVSRTLQDFGVIRPLRRTEPRPTRRVKHGDDSGPGEQEGNLLWHPKDL